VTAVRYRVNGIATSVEVGDEELLLDVLRDRCGCLSVREGCGVGACGACTAIVDGEPISTCLARASRHDGAEIVTVEGLPADDPVRRAFVAEEAFQCGYCTPGFALMVRSLLDHHPRPTDDQIAEYLEGSLCRCGAYPEILAAVRSAERLEADQAAGGGNEESRRERVSAVRRRGGL
jgi:carbon-monoxide dehydrogenase small subunit